jgi:two-component system, NarL family, response regulator NreC
MIRILIVDDHAILREGLRALLSYYPDVEVVGEAEDGLQAIECVERLSPDIVLMDIAMPGMNGLEATRRIRENHSNTHILVLTQYEDQPYVLELLRAGVAGYVLKRALGADLINAVRAVAQGESFLYPAVATTVLEQLRRSEENTVQDGETLTPREQEILQRVSAGETSRQIGLALNISAKTVEWHRGNLMNKLEVHSIAELVRYAIEHGLTK